MNTKKMRSAALAAFLGTAVASLPEQALAQTTEFTEAKVFEWWDDGFIAPEEANEILALMDEGNMHEACILAEIYAGEPCDDNLEKLREHYRGHITFKLRFDSTGSISGHREELQFTFHRLTLRLGTQELLTYKSKRGEAHFGQISTRELHSAIPLDTLWGTALAYSLGKFRFAAALDTSKVANLGIAVEPFSKFTAQATLWTRAESAPATTEPATNSAQSIPATTEPATNPTPSNSASSASLALDFPQGKVFAWYQTEQAFPLLHFEFRGKKSQALFWKTTGYIHGDSVPFPARLSSGILASRFWTTQSVTFRAKTFFDTKATVNARVLSPLHSDSISGRLDASATGGPEFLRPALKVTCIEAASDCDQTVFQAKIASSHAIGQMTTTFSGGARARYERSTENWQVPRLEIGIAVSEKPAQSFANNGAQSSTSKPAGNNTFRLSLVAPESRPDKKMQIRTETRIYGDYLEFALTAAFQRTESTNFRPTHAQICTGIFF